MVWPIATVHVSVYPWDKDIKEFPAKFERKNTWSWIQSRQTLFETFHKSFEREEEPS